MATTVHGEGLHQFVGDKGRRLVTFSFIPAAVWETRLKSGC
jgi:hypothetical protein